MRVLVAIDGSAPASLAVDLAADIAWPDGTTIRVVEAVETGAALFGEPWPVVGVIDVATIEADLRAQAERNVVDGRARLERPSLTVESAVLRGRPATAIVVDAKAMAADLIVVGSRGHGTIESMLLGSVSAEVIDHASAPVLIARGRQIERVVRMHAVDRRSHGSSTSTITDVRTQRSPASYPASLSTTSSNITTRGQC